VAGSPEADGEVVTATTAVTAGRTFTAGPGGDGRGAEVSGAEVSGAEVSGAEVSGAELSGALAPEEIVARLVEAGVRVRGFSVERESLEDRFVALTGEGFDVAQ